MQYTDQLVATGQLNDVGNVVRVNVDDSYRRGLEIEAGVQVTPTLRVDANATLSQNKIALFEETIYDYDENFSYVNVIEHEGTDIALSPNAVGMGMLTFEAPKESALAGVSFSLIGKHGTPVLGQHATSTGHWMPSPRWMRWFAWSAIWPLGSR